MNLIERIEVCVHKHDVLKSLQNFQCSKTSRKISYREVSDVKRVIPIVWDRPLMQISHPNAIFKKCYIGMLAVRGMLSF